MISILMLILMMIPILMLIPMLMLMLQKPKYRDRMALEKEEWREEKLTKVSFDFQPANNNYKGVFDQF